MRTHIEKYLQLVEAFRDLHGRCLDLQRLGEPGDRDCTAAQALLAELQPEQIEVINRLFQRLHASGVADALDRLERLQTEQRLLLELDDEVLPEAPLGNSLAADWEAACAKGSARELLECPVHEQQLDWEVVAIRYGLPARRPDYHQAREQLFPLANAFVQYGYVVGEQTTAETFFCTACRHALAAWSASTGVKLGLPENAEAFLARYRT